mgnify:CR=1 FL=1
MRTSSIILISLVSIMVLAIPAQAWVAEPTEETGYYYMYDDQSDPPFSEPQLPPMPDYDSIWQDPDAEKFCTYSDYSYRYTMVDSFWYFGVWCEPDDDLWLTDEGYISFDPACDMGDYPNPPIDDPPFPVTADPNAIIAPLWQDNDCTQTPNPNPTGENRVYYLYDTEDKNLIIEWYRIQGHASTHEYTFEVVLHLGGQDKLVTEDPYGVVFSYHFIEFLYNTSSAGWDANSWHDPPAVGFEDQDGTHGIYYQGDLADGRVIRIGYKGLPPAVKEDGFLSPIETLSVQSKTEGYDIHFSVPSHTHVMLEVFDVSGRHLRTLADKTYTAGTHTLYWNGCDAKGHKIAQGVYLVRMEADGRRTTRKVVVY